MKFNVTIEIKPLLSTEDARECAKMMANSEPRIILQRNKKASLKILTDPSREVHVVCAGDKIAGFAILQMQGAFTGYIQTICIAPEWRNRGLGSHLLKFAEERIFRETPNIFMCLSSFNDNTLRLYRRLGYETVGELKDYIVPGHSENLLRKTIGPLTEFNPPASENDDEKKT